MEQNTLEVTEQTEVFAFTSIRELVNQTLEKNYGQALTVSGLSTGFNAFDQATGGFQKGQLIVVAVKPGMGKTAFLLSIANNMAIKNDYSVAIFSAERSNQKMTSRLIESETGMSLDKIKYGKLKASEKDHMHSLVNSIAKANIFLDDTPALAVEDLIRKCRQLKLKHQVDLIIIDYLELLSARFPEPENRKEQLSMIVQRIREAGRELNLPVLLFSQMPTAFPGFANTKRPDLKDIPVFLSEMADMVVFLHRNDLVRKNGHTPGKEEVELLVAKHRASSKTLVVPVTYIESIAKFVD